MDLSIIDKILGEENTKRSKDRMSICKSCEEFRPSLGQCKKCMCFMEAKTRLEHATCPLGKW